MLHPLQRLGEKQAVEEENQEGKINLDYNKRTNRTHAQGPLYLRERKMIQKGTNEFHSTSWIENVLVLSIFSSLRRHLHAN